MNFGITEDDLKKINSEKEFIRQHLDSDPAALALNGVAPSVCTQIKYLQKSRTKLPHYYDSLCIIPPLSYEQASSRQTAYAKNYSGRRLLDLTCGLGVDAERFSKTFDEVTSIERDPLIAEIAKLNFNRLGARDIHVINSDCADFLKRYDGEPFDMVYCDPARRDDTKRTFLLSDCSPDIMSLLSDIKRISRRLVIKLSPLFDTEEIVRLFPTASVNIISLNGECKEVLADIDFEKEGESAISCTVTNSDGTYAEYTFQARGAEQLQNGTVKKPQFLYIADVAFKKAKKTAELMALYFPEHKCEIHGTVVLGDSAINDFPGRKYHIIDRLDYKPKTIKKYLAEKGITSATVVKENFGLQPDAIRKSFGLKDGSDAILIATDIDGKPTIFFAERLKY